MPIITRMFSSIGANDLAALKEYFDSGESDINQYVQTIDYTYDVTPRIFLVTDETALAATAGEEPTADESEESSESEASGGNVADGAKRADEVNGDAADDNEAKSQKNLGYRQVNPDISMAPLGISSTASTNSLMSMSMSTNQFGQLLGDASIVEPQYDVVAGHWPQAYNEVVLVLSGHGRSSDYLLYLLGLKDYSQLEAMIRQFANEEEVVVPEGETEVTYEQIMGVKLRVVNPADFYRYDSEYKVWVDKSDDDAFMAQLVEKGEELVIAGIVRPNPDAKVTALSSGLYYSPDLITHLVEYAEGTTIVKDQLADPKIDVFNGRPFDEQEDAGDDFAMDSLFTIDNEALEKAFTFDTSKLSMDMGSLANMDLSSALPPMDNMDFGNFDLSGMDMSDHGFLGARFVEAGSFIGRPVEDRYVGFGPFRHSGEPRGPLRCGDGEPAGGDRDVGGAGGRVLPEDDRPGVSEGLPGGLPRRRGQLLPYDAVLHDHSRGPGHRGPVYAAGD